MRRVSTVLVLTLVVFFFARLVHAEEVPPATLSKAPRLVHFVEAPPPPALATRGEASVVLSIDVDDKGKVAAVKVAEPAGDGFDEAATAAAAQFLFEPGESDGKPVPVRITYRYRFLMKPQNQPTLPDGSAPPLPSGQGIPQTAVVAQVPSALLTGYVHRKGDRVPLGGVVVILDDGGRETVSDALGYFAFEAVPLGDHTLKLRGGDILPADTKVKVNPGKRLELNIFVMAKDKYMSTVRGEKVVVQTVEVTLDQEEIKRIPGTQGDLLKAVQNLPGVARSSFLSGQLVVWGSLPSETRVYVDGVYIPILYHFGGLRSTVNGEMVQSLNFIPGAYGAERGLGLGGVVEIATRQPRSDGYHGFVQLDLIDGSLMLEGPLGKKASFAVAFRRSLLDLTLPLFTRNSSLQISPTYYDYQARLTYRPTTRDDLSLFFLGSDDTINIGTNGGTATLNRQFGSHTYYHRGMLSWLHRFASGATWSTVVSAGYDVPFQVQTGSSSAVSSADDAHVFSYTLRSIARIPLSSFLRLDAGVDFEGNLFSVDQTAAVASAAAGDGNGMLAGFGNGIGMGGMNRGGGGPSTLTVLTNHVAPLVSANFSFLGGRLLLIPQLRLQVFTTIGYPGTASQFSTAFVTADPRFLFRFQAASWITLKAGFGLYHEAPLPQYLSVVNGNPQLEPEYGLHYVAGVEFKPMSRMNINLEGFYKDLRNLVVRGELPSDPAFTNEGIGRVYGAQLLVRLELWRNLFGWVSYTLSRSERLDHTDQDWHLFQYDQTHILTMLASYKLPRGFQIGLRFRYTTGNPYTATASAFYDSNTDRYQPIQGPLFGDRVGSFVQLDARFDKTFTFNRWKLSLYLDLQNVTNTANPESVTYNYNYTQQNVITGLPILPAFGIRGEF